MNRKGSFLGDLLGKNYNSDTINKYAIRLKNDEKVPFVHFAEEGLEDELLVFSNSQNNNEAINSQKEAEDMGAASSLMGVYEDLDYPLKRGPFFYASNYELNYSHRTYIIFTQDGLISENPEGIMEPILYPWDSWKEVLYTKHAKLDAPVILLASPTKKGVPEISISPILTIDKNVKITMEDSEETSSAIEPTYNDLALAEMNFAYQTLKRFWKVVDENRNSDSNEISSSLFSILYKKDFKIFEELEEEERKRSIKYQHRIVKKLENHNPNDKLQVTIEAGNGVYEELSVSGSNWGIGYAMDCVMEWNTGEFSQVMVVSDLINLLKQKTLHEMNKDDFDNWDSDSSKLPEYEFILNETANGYLNVRKIEWDGKIDEDEEIDNEELYNDGDIDDSEYKFTGLYALTIESEELGFYERFSRDYWKGDYTSGKEKFEKEDYKGAIEDFTKVIEFIPEYENTWHLRGKAKSKNKDYQGAIEDFSKAIEIDKENDELFSDRGRAKKELEDFQGAIKDFDNAVEINAKRWGYYFSRGLAKRDLKNYQGSVEDMSKVLELNPNYKWAYQDRGKSKYELQDFQGAIEDFSKVIEIDPNFKWAYQERGKAKKGIKDYRRAIEDFSKVIEIDPNYKWAYQESGEAKSLNKDYNDAIIDFNRVIEIDPDYKWAYEGLGIAKSNIKDYSGAIESFDMAIEKGAKWSGIYYYRGLAKHDNKDFEGAIKDYNEAIYWDSSNIHRFYNVELAKKKLDSFKGNMMSLKGNSIDENYVNAYLNRSFKLGDGNHHEKAIQDLNTIIEIDSSHAEAYFYRGYYKLKLHDYKGSIVDLSSAIDKDYALDYSYHSRGNAKKGLKDYQGAINDYSKVLEIDPNDKDAYSDRGFIKVELKDYQGAIQDYDKAIEIDQDFEKAYSRRAKAKVLNKDFQGAIDDYTKTIEMNGDLKEEMEEQGVDLDNKGSIRAFIIKKYSLKDNTINE